ncbi:MAG: MBL fold metallo-hydrolase [Methyloligella sp. ZOD6]
MSLKITILGCGTSGGVPRIGGVWGACDPDNPKNRRLRCSLLVEKESDAGKTTVLVDSSPDLRQQMLNAGVSWVDGVLYTHDHADHTHGIDDLRMIAFNGKSRVHVYHDAETGAVLRRRFDYCFETPPGSEYPPILNSTEITPGEVFVVSGAGGDIAVLPYLQQHGSTHSIGYRFGGIAYSPDVSDLPEESLPFLQGLDVWILDALRPAPHPSHFSLEEALSWIDRIKPARAVLTHMHIDLDYETLRQELPETIEPAYDGLVLHTEESD